MEAFIRQRSENERNEGAEVRRWYPDENDGISSPLALKAPIHCGHEWRGVVADVTVAVIRFQLSRPKSVRALFFSASQIFHHRRLLLFPISFPNPPTH